MIEITWMRQSQVKAVKEEDLSDGIVDDMTVRVPKKIYRIRFENETEDFVEIHIERKA